MKQVDILRRAKDYLDQLSNRTDPLSGARLPAFSAVWDDDIHKLLYFAAKNLVWIIHGDDKDDRVPFSITPQQRAALVPAGRSVGGQALVEQINQAVDLRVCRGLTRAAMQSWLAEQGYLQAVDSQHYRPTAEGRARGIYTSPSYHQGNSLLFHQTAQQFVYDSLEVISASLQGTAAPAKSKRVAVEHPELLQRNRQAMELLSQGRHPITKAPLDPQDPLGQERLRKCFAFVAQAFARSLETGHFTARRPFSLPRELWAKIPVCDSVMLLQFLFGINGLIPDPTAVEPLSREPVMRYLTAQGLMDETLTKTGRRSYKPTPQGNAMGITLGEGTNAKDGSTFTTTFYSAAAQRYLIDHMDDLIALAAQ